MGNALTILLPVYNDAASLQIVLQDIGRLDAAIISNASIVVVNDGSSHFELPSKMNGISISITVIHLSRNLGHQKAIAIGLSWIKENMGGTKVIVMDCDGEDCVEDIPMLLKESEANDSTIFFAARKRRTNGLPFKVFYYLYKLSFYLFTGRKISFGNYSIIPPAALSRVVYYSEIWNNYPGGIIKSGIPYKALPAARGKRHAGESKMSFTSLLLHGFGAIAVFTEVIITRVAIISFLLMMVSFAAIVVIFSVRTFTMLAIPGWASTLGSSMFIILLISFVLSLITLFIYLSSQSQRKFIPALHYKDHVLKTETV
jgi:polyisoprenyl-phosphate glycosyltransferase